MAHAVMPYKVYEGVRELTSLPIPTALLSNRSKWQMDKLLSPSEAVDNIKFPEHRGLIPFPVFTYPQDEDEGAFAKLLQALPSWRLRSGGLSQEILRRWRLSHSGSGEYL